MSVGEVEEFPTVKRTPGRPRKNTVVTKQEFIDEVSENPDEEKETIGFSGLFDASMNNIIARVRVIRRDPSEGTVGYLEDSTAGEAEIFERWGGSTYILQALDNRGGIRKSTTLKIAGDPIFVSKVAEMQWRRSRGVPAEVAHAKEGLGMQEMLMFMQQQDERQRSADREHQAMLRKLELDAREKERKDDEDRERRRAKDDEDREARRRRDQAEAEQRQQQFMQQTIQMLQQSSTQALQFVKATAETQHKPGGGNDLMDAVKTVVAIKEAFAGEGGDGGEETVLQTLLKHGGEWISGLSTGITGAIREVKQGGVNGQQPSPPPRIISGAVPMTASSPLALLPAGHPLNSKVETLVAKLAAKGLDPLAAMDTIVSNVLLDVDKIPQQGKPPATVESSGPKPYVQSPVGMAQTTAPTVATVTEEKPKVVRLSFGMANK